MSKRLVVVVVAASSAVSAVAGCSLLSGEETARPTVGLPFRLEPQDQAAIRRFERPRGQTVYWLGWSFEEVPLTQVDHAAKRVRRPMIGFNYGDCEREPCPIPLTVQVSGIAHAHPSRFGGRCFRGTLRGVPAHVLPGESALELYTERTTVKVMANDAAQVLRAARALRRFRGHAAPTLPPPSVDVASALSRCTKRPLLAAVEAAGR